MQKEDPTVCRLMGFDDDPTKSDQQNLRLEADTIPVWLPGYSMRGPQVGWPEAGSQK
jgi:hypothetical protein